MSVRTRRRGREQAFRLLFQVDQAPLDLEDVIAAEADFCELKPEAWQFACELARGAWAHLAELDAKLGALADHWTVPRMAAADRALLRLAAYELLHRADTPVAVTINEAVELAKRYGDNDSPRFVNGILGAIARELAAAAAEG